MQIKRSTPPGVAVCEECGIRFTPARQTKGRFCSAACYYAYWKRKGQREMSAKGLARLGELAREGRDPRASKATTWKRRMAFRNTALSMAPEETEEDDLEWAERGGYWAARAEPDMRVLSRSPSGKRKPLLLTGHGVRLRIDYGSLLVRNGFTHYPQEAREHRFFAGDPRLPSRIVLIAADGYVSLDVVTWLSRQGIPLIVLDWRGNVVSVLGQEAAAPDLALRHAQLEAQHNGAGLHLAVRLIEARLSASRETLSGLPDSAKRQTALRTADEILSLLGKEPPSDIETLRMLEAQAAGRYFAAWSGIDLSWKGTGRHPIPPEWRRIGVRQTMLRADNRHAIHPVNAMLNYGYAVLEAQVRVACSEAGLDPTVGFLHSNRPGRAAFVYDLMEPHRPRVDRSVLALVGGTVFHPGDFTITQQGVCRLHPELARALVRQVGEGAEIANTMSEIPGLLQLTTDPVVAS